MSFARRTSTTGKRDWDAARKRDLVRDRGADPIAPSWWLVPRTRGRCGGCGHVFAGTAAYCHDERRSLCEVCWEREGIVPVPSRRYLAQAAGKR
jgi:hypothetical protein